MRRLRVLSDHPHVGRAGDVRAEFEGAQAYVDIGVAEWIVERAAEVETTDRPGAPERTVVRPSGSARARRA